MSSALGAAASSGGNPYLLGAQVGLAGISALSRLFRKKHNFREPKIDPFSFTPDMNDPEIAMRRKAALLDIQRSHASTVNEIGRAGLLGSSAAFNVLNQNETEGNSQLEDIPNSVFAKQRMDALTLYRDNANFKRQLALGDQGNDAAEHMAGLDALGSLGESIGYGADEYTRRKKKFLLGPNADYDSYGMD